MEETEITPNDEGESSAPKELRDQLQLAERINTLIGEQAGTPFAESGKIESPQDVQKLSHGIFLETENPDQFVLVGKDGSACLFETRDKMLNEKLKLGGDGQYPHPDRFSQGRIVTDVFVSDSRVTKLSDITNPEQRDKMVEAVKQSISLAKVKAQERRNALNENLGTLGDALNGYFNE